MTTLTARPHREPRTWLSNPATIIIAAMMTGMTFSASGAAPTPLYHRYQERFGLTSAMVTVIFAAYVLSLLLALLTTGPLSDHVGRRPTVLGALILNIIAMVMFITAGIRRCVDLFEAANGGTLLLDEIGDVPPAMQVKLLRVLQEREVRRVGENRTRAVNVRVLAATNRDLLADVHAARFRQDLYYRLRVVEIVRCVRLREIGPKQRNDEASAPQRCTGNSRRIGDNAVISIRQTRRPDSNRASAHQAPPMR